MAVRSDDFSQATGFSVEITGAPGASAGADGTWKVVRGGGIRFNENAGTTRGSDQFMQHSLGQREWDDLVLIGCLSKGRKAMLQWYADTVAGKDHRRNVSVIIHGRDTQETHRYNFLDCFLTSYRLTELDADSEVECEEEIHMSVGRSDNYLAS
jgi:phage tail-like protein